MLPLVHEEFAGLLVLFGADGALVGPVVGVYLHVVLKILPQREPLLTFSTLERSHFQV